MVRLAYTHVSLAKASDMDKPNVNGSEKCGPLTGRAGEYSLGNTPPVGVDYALSIPRYSLISNIIFSVLKTDQIKGTHCTRGGGGQSSQFLSKVLRVCGLHPGRICLTVAQQIFINS